MKSGVGGRWVASGELTDRRARWEQQHGQWTMCDRAVVLCCAVMWSLVLCSSVPASSHRLRALGQPMTGRPSVACLIQGPWRNRACPV